MGWSKGGSCMVLGKVSVVREERSYVRNIEKKE